MNIEHAIFILGWSADWRSELNGFNPLRMEAVGQVVDILLSWLVESALFLASVLGRPWLVPALLAASVLATGLTVASTSWLVVRDFSKLVLNYFLNCWNRPKIEPNPHIVREVAYIVFCKKKIILKIHQFTLECAYRMSYFYNFLNSNKRFLECQHNFFSFSFRMDFLNKFI